MSKLREDILMWINMPETPEEAKMIGKSISAEPEAKVNMILALFSKTVEEAKPKDTFDYAGDDKSERIFRDGYLEALSDYHDALKGKL